MDADRDRKIVATHYRVSIISSCARHQVVTYRSWKFVAVWNVNGTFDQREVIAWNVAGAVIPLIDARTVDTRVRTAKR